MGPLSVCEVIRTIRSRAASRALCTQQRPRHRRPQAHRCCLPCEWARAPASAPAPGSSRGPEHVAEAEPPDGAAVCRASISAAGAPQHRPDPASTHPGLRVAAVTPGVRAFLSLGYSMQGGAYQSVQSCVVSSARGALNAPRAGQRAGRQAGGRGLCGVGPLGGVRGSGGARRAGALARGERGMVWGKGGRGCSAPRVCFCLAGMGVGARSRRLWQRLARGPAGGAAVQRGGGARGEGAGGGGRSGARRARGRGAHWAPAALLPGAGGPRRASRRGQAPARGKTAPGRAARAWTGRGKVLCVEPRARGWRAPGAARGAATSGLRTWDALCGGRGRAAGARRAE